MSKRSKIVAYSTNPSIPKFKKFMLAELEKAIKTAPVASSKSLIFSVPGMGEYKVRANKASLVFLRAAVKKIDRKGSGINSPAFAREASRPGEAYNSKFRIELPDYFVYTDGPIVMPTPKSPRPVKYPERLAISGNSPYVTNGHYVVKESVISKPLLLDSSDTRIIEAKEIRACINNVYASNGYKPAIEAQGRLVVACVETVAVFTNGVVSVPFNSAYIDWLHKEVPCFSLSINFKWPTSAAIVMSAGKRVGLLMPMRQNLIGQLRVIKTGLKQKARK